MASALILPYEARTSWVTTKATSWKTGSPLNLSEFSTTERWCIASDVYPQKSRWVIHSWIMCWHLDSDHMLITRKLCSLAPSSNRPHARVATLSLHAKFQQFFNFCYRKLCRRIKNSAKNATLWSIPALLGGWFVRLDRWRRPSPRQTFQIVGVNNPTGMKYRLNCIFIRHFVTNVTLNFFAKRFALTKKCMD